VLFFKSPLKKARQEAEGTLHLASKILAYRKDVLPSEDLAALESIAASLKQAIKDKQTERSTFERLQTEAEPVFKRAGGSFYPRRFLAENAEMILFAAVLAIGVRTFFLQPFKIPTNSMYPSFNGMTARVYVGEPAPGALEKGWRFLTLGAKHYKVGTEAGGELAFSAEQKVVPGRKWLVLPTQKVRYTFYIGAEPVSVDLPMEFDIRQVIEPIMEGRSVQGAIGPDGTRIFKTGLRVGPGETAFAFDLLTGDQLFVDRFSYHFRRPQVGDPIVFRTDNLPHIDMGNRGKYYIKRAVAGPGDELQIAPPDILLNGEPITGSVAFEKNRQQVDNYSGYVYGMRSQNYPLPQADGRTPVRIPDQHYFAMGDNSPNSADSRMWGFVPQREIIGRAAVIYYPFSHRWGLAK
jgi:signal peptidase I